MKLLPALVIANTLQWSFGKLNRVERRRRRSREIRQYQPDSSIDATSAKQGGDVGILFQDSYADFYEGSRFLQGQPQTCSPDKIVNCEKGYNIDDKTQSCQDACGGFCCFNPENATDTDACAFFTGSVCKDGISCIGQDACLYADIKSVVRSCNGQQACDYAGFTPSFDENGEPVVVVLSSYIGEVVDSCQGGGSCQGAARGSKDGKPPGSIKSIVNSCHGDSACQYTGAYGGYVGPIEKSCQGGKACQYAASGKNDTEEVGGTILQIYKSCIGEGACVSAGEQGYIGNVTKSCLADNSCIFAAELGNITSITQSCNGKLACYFAAYKGTIEGGIYKSCIRQGSCGGAASYGGFIGGVGIFMSCNAKDACYNTDYKTVEQTIPQGFATCCNKVRACEGDSFQGDLPDDCVAKVPK